MVNSTNSDYFFHATPTNLGPLTTAFVPAASCTGINAAGPGNEAWFEDEFFIENVHCDVKTYNDCRPGPSDAAGTRELESNPYSYAAYHSPGVVCPSGWTTAYTFAYTDAADGAYQSLSNEDDYFLASLPLEKSETVVACCPKKFHGDRGICIGPTATVTDPSLTYQCSSTEDIDNYRTQLEDGVTLPTHIYSSTTIPIDVDGKQLRPLVDAVIMVHRAEDVSRYVTAAPTGSSSPKETGSGKESGSAKETGSAKGKNGGNENSSAGNLKISVSLVTSIALFASKFVMAF